MEKSCSGELERLSVLCNPFSETTPSKAWAVSFPMTVPISMISSSSLANEGLLLEVHSRSIIKKVACSFMIVWLLRFYFLVNSPPFLLR